MLASYQYMVYFRIHRNSHFLFPRTTKYHRIIGNNSEFPNFIFSINYGFIQIYLIFLRISKI